MRPKIILFGDSITEESFANEGWGSALANHFSRSADVVVRGYSGYNTRWAVEVMERVFAMFLDGAAPVAVTLFFGANDASLPDQSSGFQHVPIGEYKQNLRAMVSFLKGRWPGSAILLITPPPIDEEGRLRFPFAENPSGLPERTNESAGTYAKVCKEVATEYGLLALDIWTKIQQFPGWEKACLRDGLHLTPSGNWVVFNEVVEALKQKGISTETLTVDLPLLGDMDRADPMKVFRQ